MPHIYRLAADDYWSIYINIPYNYIQKNYNNFYVLVLSEKHLIPTFITAYFV